MDAKLYALREKVSESERLYIEEHYHQNVTGQLEKAEKTYERQQTIAGRAYLTRQSGWQSRQPSRNRKSPRERPRGNPDCTQQQPLRQSQPLIHDPQTLEEEEATAKQAQEKKLEIRHHAAQPLHTWRF